jgi:hypothetical protein
MNNFIGDEEYLYRGIIQEFWDYENNRPSSASFKDSLGVSVDRDGGRVEKECAEFLLNRKEFFAIAKIQTKTVRELNAIAKYTPKIDNHYHSEIHDSVERIRLRGKKPAKLRDYAIIVLRRF